MSKKKKQKVEKPQSFTFLNKYVVAGVAFVFWMIFMDNNNVFSQYKLAAKVNSLEEDKVQLQEDLIQIKQEKIDLEQNKEKYIREKYYFHRDNEEVFIIERDEQ